MRGAGDCRLITEADPICALLACMEGSHVVMLESVVCGIGIVGLVGLGASGLAPVGRWRRLALQGPPSRAVEAGSPAAPDGPLPGGGRKRRRSPSRASRTSRPRSEA
eukprot:720983-Lingulodinium_polyedra.AAC.1